MLSLHCGAAALRAPARGQAPQRRARLTVHASTLPSKYTKVTPCGDRVLVKVSEEETTTAGGIVLPSSAVNKPTTGVVVAVGDGYNAKTGKKQAIELSVGDRVVYSKMAGTEVSTASSEQIILRVDDVIGTLEGDDIAKLRPSGDRVLVAKASLAAATRGGVLLPGSSGGGAPTGRVVAAGPGRVDDETGAREAVGIPAGVAVLYSAYSGIEYEAAKGDAAAGYVILRKDDIIVQLE